MSKGFISFDHHLHYYDVFDLDALLDAASAQLRQHSQGIVPAGEPLTLAVCLLESQGSQRFEALSNGGLSGEQWELKEIIVPGRLLIMQKGGHELHIISGVQLNSSEGIEVLAFGDTTVDSGSKSLFELVETLVGNHAILLPWAVGKWLGKRGNLLNDVLDQFGDQLMLGDNSGRPALWNKIEQFERAKQANIPLLPGSDPLPVAGAEPLAGSNGVIVRGQLRNEEDLEAFLQRSTFCKPLSEFATRASLLQFLQQQLALRLAK
jgi:hypothetical protein